MRLGLFRVKSAPVVILSPAQWHQNRESVVSVAFDIWFQLMATPFVWCVLISSFNQNSIRVFVTLICAIIHGNRLRYLGNLMHETCHYTVLEKRSWNRSLGELLAILQLCSYRKYKWEHMSHHRYLGDPNRDLDFVQRPWLASSKHQNGLVNLFYWVAAYLRFWKSQCRVVFWDLKNPVPFWTILRVGVGLILAFLAFFPSVISQPIKEILGFHFVVFFVVYPLFKFMGDVSDHYGVISSPLPHNKSRDHEFKYEILNWLFFPRNDAYHKMHHLYPWIPSRCLKKHYHSVT